MDREPGTAHRDFDERDVAQQVSTLGPERHVTLFGKHLILALLQTLPATGSESIAL